MPFCQYLKFFIRNSNRKLLKNYLLYFFIDYSGFFIANSPYSSPGKNLSSLSNFGPIQHPKTLSFRGSEHSLNYKFLDAMFIAWPCGADVVFSYVKQTDEQNFPYYDPYRLINNKISGLHKSTYEEPLEKD